MVVASGISTVKSFTGRKAFDQSGEYFCTVDTNNYVKVYLDDKEVQVYRPTDPMPELGIYVEAGEHVVTVKYLEGDKFSVKWPRISGNFTPNVPDGTYEDSNNLALEKKGVVIPSAWSDYEPIQAVDSVASNGNTNNYWSSYQTADATLDWLQIDLGRPCQIARIELVIRQSENDPWARHHFEIRASNDSMMAEGEYKVLGAVRDTKEVSFPRTWSCEVKEKGWYRYIRAIKTKLGWPWTSSAQNCAFGGADNKSSKGYYRW